MISSDSSFFYVFIRLPRNPYPADHGQCPCMYCTTSSYRHCMCCTYNHQLSMLWWHPNLPFWKPMLVPITNQHTTQSCPVQYVLVSACIIKYGSIKNYLTPPSPPCASPRWQSQTSKPCHHNTLTLESGLWSTSICTKCSVQRQTNSKKQRSKKADVGEY